MGQRSESASTASSLPPRGMPQGKKPEERPRAMQALQHKWPSPQRRAVAASSSHLAITTVKFASGSFPLPTTRFPRRGMRLWGCKPRCGYAALARKTSAAPTSAHQTGRAGCADQLPGFIIDSVDLLPQAFIQGRVAMSRTLVWQPAIAYRPIFNVEPKLQILELKSRLRWLCESLLLLRAAK